MFERDPRGWIRVEDGLPEENVGVIVVYFNDYRKRPDTYYGSLTPSGKWVDDSGEWPLDGVTHWQPLPELPEGLGAQDD